MPSGCPTTNELEALLKGSLTPTETGRLEKHLAECAACRQQLDSLAGGDESWLKAKHADQTEPISSHPLRVAMDRLKVGSPSEKAGDRIGRYKLLEQIGEGGCGVVYVAEQEEPVRRRVALKIIKLGMDTKSVIARFEAERQALALMDHPNIAKVFDAGATETGRPYFVMELVRGMKITEYCDEAKLTTRARLDLFVHVCQAIQHAHQKGIIHRDIKPSNVLVTVNDGVPVPKVIDFGIAKATNGQQLTDKTIYTALEQFVGTPAYMSPEQAVLTSLDIDTRSDIYALGVLLYELLTGTTPFDAEKLLRAGFDEMRRIIQEEEPARPSTCLRSLEASLLTTVAQKRKIEVHKLIHSLRGDLDQIVMKALDKDRKRRYDTANAFATDVGNYLRDEPVSAVPPGVIYVTWKLLRRRRRALGFAATVVASGLLLMALREQRRLVEQTRAAADTEARDSRRRQVKLQLAADLAHMRLEEAEILGRVIDKLTLSNPQRQQAQVIVARLAERIHKGEGSDEDHLLLARFLTQNAYLGGSAIQSIASPSLHLGMDVVRDYPINGIGILIRPKVTTGDREIVKSDWVCANGGGGAIGINLDNVISKPGVWHFSCVLEAVLVDDRKNAYTWISGGQDPKDYRVFGKVVRMPIAPVHRTFLQSLPTDYPVAVTNEQQANQLAADINFVGGRLVKQRSGSFVGEIRVIIPKRQKQEWARPLPVALQMEFVELNGQPFQKDFTAFLNGQFLGSKTQKYNKETVTCDLKISMLPGEAKALPATGIVQLEVVLRSSRELALGHDQLDQFLYFPEIRRTIPLRIETQTGSVLRNEEE